MGTRHADLVGDLSQPTSPQARSTEMGIGQRRCGDGHGPFLFVGALRSGDGQPSSGLFDISRRTER